MLVTKIFQTANGELSLAGDMLATVDQWEWTRENQPKHEVFDAFLSGYLIELTTRHGGSLIYELDENLDLIYSNNSYYERADHRPGDLEYGDWVAHCRCSDEPGSVTSRSYYPDDGYRIADTCPLPFDPLPPEEYSASPFSPMTEDEKLAIEQYKARKRIAVK